MEQHILFKLLLNHEFFTENSRFILDEYFGTDLQKLYTTVVTAHKRYGRTITIPEVREMHFSDNAVLTEAKKHNINILLTAITEAEDIQKDVADDLLQILYRREVGRRVANAALKIADGRTENFSDIQKLVNDFKETSFKEIDVLEAVSTDIQDIIDGVATTVKWDFNIPSLKEFVKGIGPEIFSIFFARPEVGKTALWVSLVAAPGGFAHQGAKVSAIINEEPAYKTMSRCLTAATGMIMEDIPLHRDEAKALFKPIEDNVKLHNAVDMSIDALDRHVEEEEPDILIIDAMDKVRIEGGFARRDEKLQALYIRGRELAKREELAVIAISQASADGHNQGTIDYNILEGSRTGKAAEADLIIGVGANPILGEYLRILNVNKNKITGSHPALTCILHPQLSTYRDSV